MIAITATFILVLYTVNCELSISVLGYNDYIVLLRYVTEQDSLGLL